MPYTPNINELLEKLQQSPNDDKLLTQIAFYYMQHPDGSKDLEYFNKAYQVNPSIENTHNLANWSYHEYGDKTALGLQQQALQKQPKSYYPYVSYAQMLMSELDNSYYFYNKINASDSISYYQQIIQYYQLAIQKFSVVPIAHQQRHCHLPSLLHHNMAWAMAMLDNYPLYNYNQALNQLNKSEQLLNAVLQQQFMDMPNQDMLADNMYKILLNKIRLYILLDKKKDALELIEQIKNYPTCDDIDIADLYAQLGEYELSYQTIIDTEENIHESWQWIWYAIYQCDKEQWKQLLKKSIDNHLAYIEDLKHQNEQLQAENDLVMLADNLQSIKSKQQQVEQKRHQLEYMSQPTPSDKIKHSLQYLHLGCLLFGCPLHSNNINDDNQYIF